VNRARERHSLTLRMIIRGTNEVEIEKNWIKKENRNRIKRERVIKWW